MDIKNRLLDCTGQTSTQVGQQVLDLTKKDVYSKSTALLIQQVRHLWKHTIKDATNMDEALTLLTIAKIQWLLSSRSKQNLDGRKLKDIADLCEILQSWESTEVPCLEINRRPSHTGNNNVATQLTLVLDVANLDIEQQTAIATSVSRTTNQRNQSFLWSAWPQKH